MAQTIISVSGLWYTLVTSHITLILTAGFAFILYPLLSQHFGNRITRWAGHCQLAVMRSTPELVLALLFFYYEAPHFYLSSLPWQFTMVQLLDI